MMHKVRVTVRDTRKYIFEVEVENPDDGDEIEYMLDRQIAECGGMSWAAVHEHVEESVITAIADGRDIEE